MSPFAVAVKELKNVVGKNEVEVSVDAKNIIATLFKKTMIGGDTDYKVDLNISSENVKRNQILATQFSYLDRDKEEVLCESKTEDVLELLTLRDRKLFEELRENGVEFKIKYRALQASLKHLEKQMILSPDLLISKLAVYISF